MILGVADDRRLADAARRVAARRTGIVGCGAEDPDADVDDEILVVDARGDADRVIVLGGVDRRLDRVEGADQLVGLVEQLDALGGVERAGR